MAAVMMAYPVRDSFQSYPQQYAMYQTRAHQPQVDVAQSLNVNPYSSFQHATEAQQYVQPQSKSPHPATSIITEDGFRPSLPSISNLLGIADGERGTQDPVTQQAQAQAQVQAQSQQQVPTYTNIAPQQPANDQRQPSTYQRQSVSSSQRTAVPPTPPPPMRSDSVVDNTHSPSTISTGSSLSIPQPYFVGSSLNNIEATDQRAPATHFIKRPSLPSQPNTSPYGAYTTSPYSHSPGSYYSPTDTSYPGGPSTAAGLGLYHQRQLPSNFPPQQQPQHPAPGPSAPTRNVWEHHHYISPSAQSVFPQPQDRYVCATCNKAFSRPSSLKIHSNSHTGEKPYKCPHAGCGKAFSVRSNMKRHQRGCHTEGGGGAAGILAASHLR